MTERDRLAADLHGEDPTSGGPNNECGCYLTADRLIALGWTRLDELDEANVPIRTITTPDGRVYTPDAFRGHVLSKPVDPPPDPPPPPPDLGQQVTASSALGRKITLRERCPHDGIVHTDQRTFTVRDPDDEIVGCGFVHIERMSKHHVWIGLEAADGSRVDLDIVSSKGRARMVVR